MIPIHDSAAPRSNRIARFALAAFILSIATIPGGALGSDVLPGQVPPWLRPKTSIRLTMIERGDHDPLLGEFRAARGDSIWIHPRWTQNEVALPLPEVSRFDVSREQSRRTWSGAGIGFLAGAVLGIVTGANEGKQMGDTGARIGLDGVVLGCLGMAIGALAGHAVTADHWTTIWNRGDGSSQSPASEATDQEGATR